MRRWRYPFVFFGAFMALVSHVRAAELVIDADKGIVIVADDATRRMHPASLTKLMTVYLTFQEIEGGRLSLGQKLTVSDEAAAQPPTHIGLNPGASITVEQAILATLLQSANDAAVVLAEAVAGSEDRFAAQMTTQAKSLGMTQSLFRNATGLPDPLQVTTARDMVILALALKKDFPQYGDYFSRRGFSYGGRNYGNINGLLGAFDGADGMKTGFTCASGYNLVASATRDGRHIVAVIMGAASREARLNRAVQLLKQGFAYDGGDDRLITALADASVPPPTILTEGDCALVAARDGNETGLGSAAGPGGGWGVILGSFPKAAVARSAIADARSKAGGVLGRGQAQVIKRPRDGVNLYAALVVGLRQQDASKACQTLRTKKIYCLALTPAALRNQKAPWR